MPRALITGPTSGLGRGFADAFARRGFDLVLVSRDEDRLRTTGEELTTRYGVACEVLPADLAVRADVDRVAERLQDEHSPIAALVNNAGFGLYRTFLSVPVEDEQRQVDVMVTAVMRLTHAALPGMVERGQGMVLNVSSVAGWYPGGTYSAAKSWVTVFSESLSLGLQGTGVRMIAVCPGFTHTELHERAGMDMSSVSERLWLDVPTVVDQAFKDLAAGRTVSVAGAQYAVLTRLLQHGPRSLIRRFSSSRQQSLRKN